MAKMFDKVSDSVLDSVKSVMEKKLTSAEKKKREEVAQAIERDNPDMPMDKKMAIATATAKRVAEAKLDPVDHKALKGSHADRKDKDIDNDGDVDTSDEYLHNRRKAVKKAIAKKMKEEAEQIDEISADMAHRYLIGRHKRDYDISPDGKSAKSKKSMTYDQMVKRGNSTTRALKTIEKEKKGILNREEVEQIDELSPALKSRYKTKARGDLEAAQSFQADLKHEGEPKSSPVSKDVARIIKKRKTGLKRFGEEVQQVEEGKMKDMVTKHMDGGSDYGSALKKAKKELASKTKPVKLRGFGSKGEKGNMGSSVARSHLMKKEDVLTPEEIAMIEAKMDGVADDALPGKEHMCATKVFHKEWKEGTPVPTMHADPDDQGLIEWYDVMFDHGIERVMTEDMEILDERMHGHKKKMKEETCGEGEYWCFSDQKCKPIPEGMKVDSEGMLVKEEAEQIDENIRMKSAATELSKYAEKDGGIDKADYHTAAKHLKAGNHKDLRKHLKKVDTSPREKILTTMDKHGINTKKYHWYGHEEVEQIDELSNKTLGSYVKKAKKELSSSDYHIGRAVGAREAGANFSKSPEQKLAAKAVERTLAAKSKKRYHGIDKAVDKMTKEEAEQIDEARGRPKKAGQMDYTVHPKTKEKLMHSNPTHMKRIEALYRTGALKRPKTEAGQNVITQLRKASTSMRGGETVNFTHGSAKRISAAHAQKALEKHAGMRPADKEAFQKKISHSHDHFMKHIK